ncbi:39S ribosomal protein L44, mitochondrial [Vespa velutina]|uniref:39S ribosomal protein L44, mitochondrial n=1 Tax=Vespa velutina TaxID=202808 RepID=UPI001FB2D154|nr:39S ribosomal protein L44, mitochondrial [Vespa velutina]
MNALRSLTKAFVLNRGCKTVQLETRRFIKRWVAPTQMVITKRKKKIGTQIEPIRSNFLEWNRNAELYAFNERLSEKFDPELLEQALIHKSYVIKEEEMQKQQGISDPKLDLRDNRDLIQDGRNFVSKVVHKYLLESLPNLPENGIMTIHNYLLSEELLANSSLHLGTTDLILTEEHPVSSKTLADTFLALVAALVQSVNANHAAIFVRDFLITILAEKELPNIWCPSNPLQELNDILLKEGRGPAEPRIIGETGINTLLSSYRIAVYSDKQCLGIGCGANIQEAKEVAVINALCKIYGLLDSSRPIKFDKVIEMD